MAGSPGRGGRRFSRAYFLRLVAFGLLALLAAYLVVMFWFASAQADAYVRPAPGVVPRPDDLPFTPQDIAFSGGADARTGGALRLAGWFVPPAEPPGPVVILLHGYGGTRLGMRWQAERLHAAGYGLLMLDARGSGESEATLRSYGWQDVDDIAGALAFLRARPEADPARTGILGCSIGGQVAIRAAAGLPGLRAVIADGPSIAASGDLPPPQTALDWLTRPANWMLDRMLEARAGAPPPRLVTDAIAQIAPRPLLVIAGGTPAGWIGTEAARQRHMMRRAGENAALWVVDEAVHCNANLVRPEEYERRMLDFFAAGLNSEKRLNP